MAVDLTTSYLGLQLKNPVVVSACPLTLTVASLEQLERSGAAAAVLPSLFAEQLEHDEAQELSLHEYHSESFTEALSYVPETIRWHTGPEPYLDHIRHAKRAVSIPIIGSLNGTSTGSWVRYARLIQDAGADALELNIYFVPTDRYESSETIEARYLELVTAVCRTISIPLAVKIGPFFSSLPHFARRLVDAGARGLVLFNRYLDPDIDTELLQVTPSLTLSDRHELRLPLRWIATLRDQLDVSLAATSGIHFSDDVIKALLAGADVTMMAAALLRYGPPWLESVLAETTRWIESNQYTSVSQLRGSLSLANCPDPSAYHRGNYVKTLVSYTSNLI